MDIAQRIRSARRNAGLTQLELATAVGVDPGTLSRWERGATRPRLTAVLRLAVACDVELAWLAAGLGSEAA